MVGGVEEEEEVAAGVEEEVAAAGIVEEGEEDGIKILLEAEDGIKVRLEVVDGTAGQVHGRALLDQLNQPGMSDQLIHTGTKAVHLDGTKDTDRTRVGTVVMMAKEDRLDGLVEDIRLVDPGMSQTTLEVVEVGVVEEVAGIAEIRMDMAMVTVQSLQEGIQDMVGIGLALDIIQAGTEEEDILQTVGVEDHMAVGEVKIKDPQVGVMVIVKG